MNYSNYITSFLIVLIISSLFYSCNNDYNENEILLARYKNKVLYLSDIEHLAANLNEDERIDFFKNYMEKWLKEQILLSLANTNLTNDEKDLSKEIEQYKNSLLIHKYQQKYILQNLDTVFNPVEIEEFYNQHAADFFLNENIIKALFIQLPKSAPKPETVTRYYKSNKEKDIEKLDAYCNRHAFKYDDFKDKWVSFNYVMRHFPIIIQDTETFLRTNNTIEAADSNFYYYLRIKEYRLKGAPAPLEFAHDLIKPALINKRKTELLKSIEVNSLLDALNNNDAEIFDNYEK